MRVKKSRSHRPQGVRATSVPPYLGKINNLFGGVGEKLPKERGHSAAPAALDPRG